MKYLNYKGDLQHCLNNTKLANYSLNSGHRSGILLRYFIYYHIDGMFIMKVNTNLLMHVDNVFKLYHSEKTTYNQQSCRFISDE